MQDAVKKKVVCEEACAEVDSQREEYDELERQVESARVQVQLPTPPPSLPSDGGDLEQGRGSPIDGTEDEARRDVEAGLAMDVDLVTRTRGRTPRLLLLLFLFLTMTRSRRANTVPKQTLHGPRQTVQHAKRRVVIRSRIRTSRTTSRYEPYRARPGHNVSDPSGIQQGQTPQPLKTPPTLHPESVQATKSNETHLHRRDGYQ